MIISFLAGITFTVFSFNCENAFDCRDDSLHDDSQFMPDGGRKWTPRKYWNKLRGIGKAIVSAADVDGKIPDLVALCEVENDSVVFDLTRRSLLRNAYYHYFITSSPDIRGIDIALLYSPSSFKPISHNYIRVTPIKGMRPTRDILYASGTILSGDTLHVFVVHSPSRYGGTRHTMPHRMAVVSRLTSSIDSIRSISSAAKIIVMGDFNDESIDKPFLTLLSHGMQESVPTVKKQDKAKATYRYQGLWQSIDHIVISHTLATNLTHCRIHAPQFLLTEDQKYGGYRPHRTSNGYRYEGGVSDHLPLVAKFEF